MRSKLLFIYSTIILLLIIFVSGVLAAGNNTERVSVASDGTQGNGESYYPSISDDGRYIAFESAASNLVPNSTSGHIFVRDQQMNNTTIVSVSSNGTQSNHWNSNPSISDNGRYVAFQSGATNLITNDINGKIDIFVRDCQTNTTTIVSVSDSGTQGNIGSWDPSINGDGRYIAFESYASNLVDSDANDSGDVFVRDQQTNTTSRVSVASDGTEGNQISSRPSISDDGRYVVFQSLASNLVPNDTNYYWDIFIHDRQTNTTTRASVASDGAQGNGDSYESSISGDGRYVTFVSWASNFVVNDTNGKHDVFVRDLQTSTTTRVSVASDGTQGNENSSGLGTQRTDCPSISDGGRYVVFNSLASNLVDNDVDGKRDIFVRDLQTNTTAIVNVASDGLEGSGEGPLSSMSGDGRYVTFTSDASDLVEGDTNACSDVFVADNPLYPPEPEPAGLVYLNTEYCFTSEYPGTWVPRPELVTTPYHLAACGVEGYVPGAICYAFNADAPVSKEWIINSFKLAGKTMPKVTSDIKEETLADGTKAYTYTAAYISAAGYEVTCYCIDADRCTKRIRVEVFTIETFEPYDEATFSDIAHSLHFLCQCRQDEIGIWRGATRYFYLDVNGNGTYDGAATERFGPFLSSTHNSDRPVIGDWNGDSVSEIGIWRGVTRYFYLDMDGDGTYDGAATERFGPFLDSTDSSDRPIAGDWDGDGTDEIGIWRGTSRLFFIDIDHKDVTHNFTYDGSATELRGPFLGSTQPNDMPVAGNWDSDTLDEIGVLRGATRYFYIDFNGNYTYDGYATERIGPFLSSTQANDMPIAGNWDADSRDEVGVWRGATRYFYLDMDGDGTYDGAANERLGPFLSSTMANDWPVAGNWDGL